MTVVAIVPARNSEDYIAATVEALRGVAAVDGVVVVDDGSTDGTVTCVQTLISAPGTPVMLVELARNRGKGGAVTAGIEATPAATIYVLIDADLGATASRAEALLVPVMAGEADMTIGVPRSAGKRAGFGTVRSLARRGIRRACGFEAAAPLSGQRAVRAELLRSLSLAPRFGLETGLTIDAVRAGARVLEMPSDFDHRHTGRSWAGFSHRGRQGLDIVSALRQRRIPASPKVVVAILLLFLVAAFVRAPSVEPTSVVRAAPASRVVVFAFSRLGAGDIGRGDTPVLDRLIGEGAVANTSVRTVAVRPATVEAYMSMGAGSRVRARNDAALAFSPRHRLVSSAPTTAGDAALQRTGTRPTGEVVVVGAAPTVLLNQGRYLTSFPGALGDALHAAGKRTGVVGNSDLGDVTKDPGAMVARPAAGAVMDSNGGVDFGTVEPLLLQRSASSPYSVKVNEDRFVSESLRTVSAADVTVLDPGEMDRVAAFQTEVSKARYVTLRQRATRRTDVLLGRVVAAVPPGTLMLVVGIRPATGTWELTPTVAWGAGVRHGYLHSPSTRRLALVTLTDLAPTMLDAIGVAIPSGMIGHALRYHLVRGPVDISRLRNLNDLSAHRERIYLPLTKGYVIFQTVLYLLVILLFTSSVGVGRAEGLVRWLMLAIAALPLATFVYRMIPHVWVLGSFGTVVVLIITALLATLASRLRTHPLAGLQLILGATVAVIVVDVVNGAALQQASVLGYSPHTAARFTGLGNAAFAALTACTVLWVAIYVQRNRHPRSAITVAAAVCLVVAIVDGAPQLGSDVGGILTLVPVFGLLLFALTGRRVNMRAVLSSVGVTLVVLAGATGLDLLRPADKRTHLGRLAAQVFGAGESNAGQSTLTTTISRKLSTNIRVFSGSFWTWIVPVIAIVLLFFLVLQRGWDRDLPPGSALRAGVVAALLAGLVGFAVNDSGTVVAALVFVFVGPFVTLLALERDRPPVISGSIHVLSDSVAT